jgi:hypothetical protein
LRLATGSISENFRRGVDIEDGFYIGRTFIIRTSPPAIVVVMGEGKSTPTAEKGPDKHPPWWKRLWARTGFGDKTLWDLLQLLIVPLALAVIGFSFAS